MKIYAFADEASPIIDEQIKAMKENGVDGLEIRNVDSVNIAEISDSKAKEVRKKLDNACLRVWTIGLADRQNRYRKGRFYTSYRKIQAHA